MHRMTRPFRGRVVGKVGRYRLERLISRDWMGELWAATSVRLGGEVTVRVFARDLSAAPHFVHRLREQFGHLQPRLAHDRIARVLFFNEGEDGPVPFEVMEALDGVPAAQRRRSVVSALRVTADVADALGAAHRLGMAHGALSGDTVFLTSQGVKVIDFGVASAAWNAARDEERDGISERGLPRSAFEVGEPSPSADILALEGLLNQLITGPADAGGAFLGPPSVTATAVRRQMATLIEATAAGHPDAGSAQNVALAMRSSAEGLAALAPRIDAIFESRAQAPLTKAATEAGPIVVLPEAGGTEAPITLPEPVLTRAVEKAPGPSGQGLPSPRRGRVAPKTPGPASPERLPTARAVPPVPPSAAPEIRPVPASSVAGTAARLAEAAGRGAREIGRAGLDKGRLLVRTVSQQRRAVMDGAALVLALLAVVLVFMFVLPVSHEGAGLSGEQLASVPLVPTAPTISGVRVPNVTGLTPLEASGALTRLGFVVAAARPTAGPPGEVASTTPSAGAVVAPGTAVVLFVGTDPERARDEGS